MGKLIQSELSVLGSQPVHEYELLEDVKKHYAVRITFRMQITADVDIQWDTILSGRKLYIQVSSKNVKKTLIMDVFVVIHLRLLIPFDR